jgi:hypothetical protein
MFQTGGIDQERIPLVCPTCGQEMRIIAFIEKRDQYDVIEKILRHCHLWIEPIPSAPQKFPLDPEYVPTASSS